MTTANERQHGGDHYKTSAYNHWDWVHDTKQGYLGGNASKYAFRWRRKGVPVEDLEKAIHYVDKASEVGAQGGSASHRATAFWQFVVSNDVPIADAPALWFVMEGQWTEARHALEAMKAAFLEQS